MEINKKITFGIFAFLILGVALVSAGTYYNMRDIHASMMASDDFSEMHTQMMAGNFKAAEAYHETLDFDCPMHELVKSGDVSIEDFQLMHSWMATGNFPTEKPSELSDAAWELHNSHHPA